MPSVMVWVISWATLLFLSLEATRYSEAILALSWALLALLSAILPRSSKYSLVIVVVATLSTPPSVVVSSSSKHVPTMHPAQLNIRGLCAWLCGSTKAELPPPPENPTSSAMLENRGQERSFFLCCDCENHVVSERLWPWGILKVLIGSAHPPNDLLWASSVNFRARRRGEALYKLR